MKSIEVMSDKERYAKPSEAFVNNYNRLRELCSDNNPNLDEFLPPIINIETNEEEDFLQIPIEHNFSEIHTFCSEIYYLLEES